MDYALLSIWLSRQRAERCALNATAHAVSELATPGIPATAPRSASPRRKLSGRAHPTSESPRECRTHHPKAAQSASPLANPAAIGMTWRITRNVRPAAMHTRTACAIWIAPPLLTACWADDRHHMQHERGDQDGEDRDERVVRQLRKPRLEEALGRIKEEERDEEGTQGQQHRERNARQCQKKDRIDGGQSHDQIDPEPGQVVGEIPIEHPALLQEQIGRIATLKDDLIDDPDRIKGADDDGAEFGRRIEEGVDDEAVVEPQIQRAAQNDGQRNDAVSPRR